MRPFNIFAAEMIPMRLIISIAVIAAIAILLAIGFLNLSVTLAENQIENECRTIQSKLYTMTGSGIARDVDEAMANEGTKRTHTFSLPDNIIFLAFGVDPDPDNNGILESGLNENGSVIFYRISGGSKKVIWLEEDEFKFREGLYFGDRWIVNDEEQGFILKSSGEATLTFELVEKNNMIYILIQNNDGIEP